MSDGILKLRFEYSSEYSKIDPCQLCGAEYKFIRKFYKRQKTPGGGYLFNFASPEKGYEDGEEVYISKKQLIENDINLDLESLNELQAVKLFQMVFDEEKNPDVRIRWSRLRAYLTKKYQHPDNDCRNATGDGKEKFRTEGPPTTIYQWAKPLFVALYGLGMSPREIATASLFELGIQDEVYQSVARQINKYKETASEPEREELLRLHERNRRKYTCIWDYPHETRNVIWEVTMRPIRGEMDPETVQWLKKLSDQHMKYLEFELKDRPTDPIELLITSPIPNI
jgi:hypothetical protein